MRGALAGGIVLLSILPVWLEAAVAAVRGDMDRSVGMRVGWPIQTYRFEHPPA